jgi:hypothetical protein
MIVHREPRAGRYQSIAAYGSEESVAPLASPDSFPDRQRSLLAEAVARALLRATSNFVSFWLPAAGCVGSGP